MKISSHTLPQAARLGLLSAALLGLGAAASAQSKLYYQVVNDTFSGGDPVFPVASDVTFTDLYLTETFADHYRTAVALKDLNGVTQTTLDTGTVELDSGLFTYPNTHGALKSAVLTGDLNIDGLLLNPDGTLNLTLQPTLDPASQYTQEVLPEFTATLFGTQPATGGVGVGQFSAVDGANNVLATTIIRVPSVPEPGVYAILTAGALALLPFLRRRKARGQ